jgi:hypothetical protein
MTTIAFFSDIHANLPALEAVLADRKAVEERVHAGPDVPDRRVPEQRRRDQYTEH